MSEFKIFRRNNFTPLLLSLLYLLLFLLYRITGNHYIFLSEAVDFKAPFNFLSLLLNIGFVAAFLISSSGLGKYTAKKFSLDLPAPVAISIGVIIFNLLFLLFSFLGLLYPPVLLVSLIAAAFLTKNELPDLFRPLRLDRRVGFRNRLRAAAAIAGAALLHLINAALPYNYWESLGDVVNTYIFIPMNFAYFHGVKFAPHLTASISRFLNYDLICSALIVVANPGVVKLFGFGLFILTALIIYDFLKNIVRFKWALFAPVIFMICTAFTDDYTFSFAHERVYFLLLASVSFYLLFVGVSRRNPSYHYLNFIVLGVLFGSSLAGIIPVAVTLITLLIFSDRRRFKPKKLLLFILIFALISSVFPLWYFYHTGSFSPTNPHLHRLLDAELNPDFFNDYLFGRLNLYFQSFQKPTLLSFLFFPFKFTYRLYNLLVLFIPLGLFFLGDRKLRLIYFYLLLNFAAYLTIINNSLEGYTEARYLWVLLPVIIILIGYVILKLQSWLSTINNRRKARNQPRLITNFPLFGIIALSLLISLAKVFSVDKDYSMHRIGYLKHKLAFLTGGLETGEYLGPETAKVSFLNQRFTRSDKILYLFHCFNSYIKAGLYEPMRSGSASIIYRSEDKAAIMEKLKATGVNYFCLDDIWGIKADEPDLSLAADITTPILEPDFFSRHFIPLDTGIKNFFVFRIDYDGLEGIEEVIANFNDIAGTGFFSYIYDSLAGNKNGMLRVEANPYRVESLLRKYEQARK